MSTINRLSSVDVLQPGDQIPVWDSSNGDTRKASMTTLLAFVESYFADPDYSTRIVAPAIDYFTVDIGATGDSIWLIVNPTLNFTNGAITLPPASSAVNGQEITVVFTASVSTFVITSAGATVLGAPVQIGGYDSFRVRYNSAQLTWYTLDTTGDGTGSGVSQIVRQDFTGDGATTTFTLTTAPSGLGNELQIFIDGVYQERAGYTVTGSNVVFSEAPPSLSNIEVLGWAVTLGAETSSNLVSYTPAGTGAVLTTVQAKLRESLSVKDFGAVGDGVTDDHAAITAALVAAGGTKWVKLMPGATHALSETLTLNQNPGVGAKIDGNNATLLAIASMGDMVRSAAPTCVNFQMKDLTLNANSLATTAFYGVLITEQTSLIQNVYFLNALQDGMRLDGCQAMLIQNVRSNLNGRYGFLFESCNATTVNSIRAVSNTSTGVLIQRGAQFNYTGGMQLYGVDAELNGLHGISVVGTKSPVIITGSWLESNTGDGINVSGDASGVIIKDNGIIGGIVLGDRAVRLGVSTVGCTVTDNRFQTAGGGAADAAYIQVVDNGTGVPNDTYPNYIRSNGQVIGEDISFAPIRQTQVPGVSGMLSGGVAISIPSAGSSTFTFTPSGLYNIPGASDRGAYFLEIDFVGYFAGIDQSAMARFRIFAATLEGSIFDVSATKEFEVGDTARMVSLTAGTPTIVGATNAFTVAFSNAAGDSFDGYFTWRSVSTTTDLDVTVA